MDRIMNVKRMKLDENMIKIMVVSRNKNTNPLNHKIKRVKIKEI